MNITKTILGLMFTALVVSLCWSQEDEEKTRYSRTSYRRHATVAQDRTAGIFLPTYNEIAKDKDKGITADDWKVFYLSEARFNELDEDKDGIVSREELANDPLQGETQQKEQGDDLCKQICKDKISGYADKLLAAKKAMPKAFPKSVEYILDKNGKPRDKDRCQYGGCDEVWTKSYVQAAQGQDVSKNVCLGHYTLLMLRDYERQNSLNPYIFGVVMLGLAVAASMLAPVVLNQVKSKQ